MAATKYPVGSKFRYKFDNLMSRGGRWVFLALVAVFIIVMLILAGLRTMSSSVFGDTHPEQKDPGFLHSLYITFEQMSDPGMMDVDRPASTLYKIEAIVAGLAGIVMLSALIAIITTAMESKIRELRKGHSKVIETGHTLILGWNDRVIEILRELVTANESEKNACVVIVSEEEKEEMDDFIAVELPEMKNTRVVTRSGNPTSPISLQMASIGTCKSVIVLDECNVNASVDEKTISDVSVIKTILAIVAARPADAQLNIVAAVHEHDHRTIVTDIAEREVVTLEPDSILAKMIVQTSRSIGLSIVYNELLSFEGCEMYFHHNDWGESTFGELAFHFEDGIPVGLRRGDGHILLNPPVELKLNVKDDVLILAQDDSTIEYSPEPVVQPRELQLAAKRREPSQERVLIIGWLERVDLILREYADYVLPGSTVDIMLRAETKNIYDQIETLRGELPSINVSLIEGNPMTTADLIAAQPFTYDTIILLSQSVAGEAPDRTDSATIVILLLLRNIFKAFPEEAGKTKLITEVLDSHNQSLVAHTGVHDFIISNRYVSMLLAQISEDADIIKVYDHLFQEEGSEIYLKPAALYLDSFPAEVAFADLIRLVQKRGEVCLGVKLQAHERNIDENFGVHLDPPKTRAYSLRPEDSLIVLAEDDT